MQKHTLKNKIISLTLIVLSSTLTQTAMAKSIDEKQSDQKGKISQGIRSGELTRQEAWRLGQQQKNIYQKERRFKADGDFTRRERFVIHKKLAMSSVSIYKQKHDRQKQGNKLIRGTKSHRINKRQHHQTKRIRQGVRSGQITRGEAARLGKQQRRIQHKKRKFKVDGVFTKRERVRVHKGLNRASKNIYRKKHNHKQR